MSEVPDGMTVDDYFDDHDDSRAIFEAVREHVERVGPAEIRVSKSQIAFRRRLGFAAVWMPRMYLGRGAPLVLSVSLRRRDDSPRWKEVVSPASGRYTHHLELRDASEVDGEVLDWLREAWTVAV